MKFSRFSVSFALALTLSAAGSAQAQELQARVIVRFKPAADSVRAKPMSLRMDRASARDIAQTRATALSLRTGVASASGGMQARGSLDERTHVFIASGLSSAALAKRLAADPEVEFVAVDQRRRHTAASSTPPNDPLYGIGTNATFVTGTNSSGATVYGRTIDQWYLKTPTSDVISGINAPVAWAITTGLSSIVVAVLDTGVRKDHPDLVGQFVGGYDMIGYTASAGVATANDGDGADADASDPGDWVSQADINGGTLGTGCDSTDIGNSSWHGTHVSGLIGAITDNGVGMAGVARGIKILPVRVLGKCGGYDSDIVAGMLWAAGISVPGLPANPNVAKVLNMSLGGTGSCSIDPTAPQRITAALYRDTINQVVAKGATIVVAAGNGPLNIGGVGVGLPANCPGVIAVSALRHAGSKVGFADLGPEVAISAPGGNCINTGNGEPCLYPMVSTTNSGTTTPVLADNAYTGSTATVGTSFSAPLVSGTVALMLSARPSLTSVEVLSLLQRTAAPFVSAGATAGTAQCRAPTAAGQLECYCTTSTCGAGMLDAGAAVALAQAANIGESVVITATSGVVASGTVTVDATGSTVGTGRTVASVAWSIVTPGAGAAFSAVANTLSTTLSTTTAGTFTVKVVLTDDIGVLHTNTASVTVAAAPVVTPPTTTTTASSGGGGGGAFSAGWLMLLALASGLLAWPSSVSKVRWQPKPKLIPLNRPATLSRRS